MDEAIGKHFRNDPKLSAVCSDIIEEFNILLARSSPTNVDFTDKSMKPPLQRTKRSFYDENTELPVAKYARSLGPPRLIRPAHSLLDDGAILSEPVIDCEELRDVFKRDDSCAPSNSLSVRSMHEPISGGVSLMNILRSESNYLDDDTMTLPHMEGFEQFINDNYHELRIAADQTGNALYTLRYVTFYNCKSASSQRIADDLKEALRRPYSDFARNQPLKKEKLPAARAEELKDILWASCMAFYVLKYYPNFKFDSFQTEEEVMIRLQCSDMLLDKDATNAWHLINYWWTMERSYAIFGGGRKKDFLIEFVTRITEGRRAALSSNTTGGGLGDIRGNNKCAVERCRREIYVRISGTPPVDRSHRR